MRLASLIHRCFQSIPGTLAVTVMYVRDDSLKEKLMRENKDEMALQIRSFTQVEQNHRWILSKPSEPPKSLQQIQNTLAVKEKEEILIVGDNLLTTNWGNFHVWPSSTSAVKSIASTHCKHLKDALPNSIIQCIEEHMQKPGSSSLIMTVNDQNDQNSSATNAWPKYTVRAIDWCYSKYSWWYPFLGHVKGSHFVSDVRAVTGARVLLTQSASARIQALEI